MGSICLFYIPAIILISKRLLTIFCDYFYKKNAAKDRKRAKYGDRSLKKAFR